MPDWKPEGWPSVAPRLFTTEVAGLVEFLRTVFGATGEPRAGAPAEIRIGDSVILVSDGGGLRDAYAACLYVYVEDADCAYDRAIAAGAQSIESPLDTPYGDRRAMVRDAWGNVWQIATYRGASF
jgi:uncharacterized glyoxalase superfamily protein PhnB